MPDDLDELVEKLKREPCAWCSCRHTPGPEHCLRGVVIVCGENVMVPEERIVSALNKVMWRMEIQAVRIADTSNLSYTVRRWAVERLLPLDVVGANWRLPPRDREGPALHKAMLDKGNVVMVVAFPGGAGTADMVRQAEARGIRVWKR